MYIVTGCCGFVGSTLTKRLLKRGCYVIGIDNLYRPGSAANLSFIQEMPESLCNFRFILGDISTLDLAFINSDISAIFHLAGQVAMTKSINNPLYDFNCNAYSTLRLLEAVRTQSPSSLFIYASTNKVYGDLEWIEYRETETRYICSNYPEGFDESLPLDFSSPYGCSKGAADQYTNDYARIYGLHTYCFRHSTIYGLGQKASYDQGWVGWFLSQVTLAKSNPAHRFTISGNGKQVRDILHVEDVCTLYELAATGKCPSVTANVGGSFNNSLSILELLRLACKHLGVDHQELNIDYIPARISDQRVFISLNHCASNTFGWQPSISIDQGLSELLSSVPPST
ncbi:GDP-mannose 4,6-dehydratase [Synechococcus sp. HK05]|uniref:GDP-mannose 4,6-dehydratase n=1 Tax=Synechococcus sp. HK05 TaxID=2725975 RepID=UPI001C38A478|nr:GDP-mannose 4,6-dehydratase [Synechococcus sp. HK05]MBV2352088.1 GDP-mannose 4,6-dehydratase [Synechococcus sp. HK05]